MLMVLLAALIAYRWRVDLWPMDLFYQIAMVLALLLVPLVFSSAGIYRSWRGGGMIAELRRITLALAGVVSILIILGFVTKTGAFFSRLWLGGWALLAWGFLMIFHVLLRFALRWLRQQGLNIRRIVIVGAGDLGREVVKRIQGAGWTGLKVVGLYDDNPELHHTMVAGVKVRGAPNSLQKLMRRKPVDEVWLALPLRADKRMKEILHDLRYSTVTIRFVPDIFGFRLLRHSMGAVAGIPVMNLNASPMIGINRFLKACSDRFLAAVILMIISPLMLVIAIAVKLTSHGPVLFKQRRLGWDGKPIKIYKFRTMKLHEEP